MEHVICCFVAILVEIDRIGSSNAEGFELRGNEISSSTRERTRFELRCNEISSSTIEPTNGVVEEAIEVRAVHCRRYKVWTCGTRPNIR